MSKLVNLAKDTVLYGLGSIVPRAMNFFLVALHSRIFLPESYGIYITMYAWVAFLNVVYIFGLETAYFRFATKEGANESDTFRSAQTFVIGMGLVLSSVLIFSAQPIAVYFHVPDHPEFIVWLAAIMFTDAIVAIPFAQLRLQKKARTFAAFKLTNVILNIGLNLFFLLVIYDPNIGIGYPILANLIANAFYLFFFSPTLLKWRPRLDLTVFSTMLKYALPMMLTGLAGITNEIFSRITLGWWLPENFYPGKNAEYALGIFGACFRFSVIMSVAVQAFRFAAEPFFFSNATDKNSPELFARVNHYFIVVSCFIVLGVTLYLDQLKYLVDHEYWVGLNIVPYLLFGYLFLGIYWNLSVWYKLTDRTHFGTIISFLGVIVTIVLNYTLIPLFGYLGSSWAAMSCYLIMLVTSYLLGQKYYPIPYLVGRGSFYVLFTGILILLASYFSPVDPWLAAVFHTVLVAFYLGLAFLLERGSWHTVVRHS